MSTILQRIEQEIEERVQELLPGRLFDKAVAFHTRKGNKEYQRCNCSYCQAHAKATYDMTWCKWNLRYKKRKEVRAHLKELKERL